MDFAPSTEGDGRTWNFIGIWSKNRSEWLITHIANMYFNYTTIGFFDSMGVQTVDYILNQTELTTMFVAGEYVSKLIQMRKDGLSPNLKHVVSFDEVTADEKEQCAA